MAKVFEAHLKCIRMCLYVKKQTMCSCFCCLVRKNEKKVNFVLAKRSPERSWTSSLQKMFTCESHSSWTEPVLKEKLLMANAVFIGKVSTWLGLNT